jgi:hypothetical protein
MVFPTLFSLTGLLFFCELFILILALINFRRFQRHGLAIILPLLFCWVITHFLVWEFAPTKGVISGHGILETCTLILGIRFFASVKRSRLELLLPLVLVFFISDVTSNLYQRRGWYNIHIYNTYHLVTAPLFFILFFRTLQLSRRLAWGYILGASIIISLFLLEFILNKTPKTAINIVTAIVFYTENIILGGLSMYKIVENPSVRKLRYEPLFWVFAGLLLDGVMNLAFFSVHPYLVSHLSEVRFFTFFPKLLYTSRIILDLCIFGAFALCVRKDSRENAGRSVAT